MVEHQTLILYCKGLSRPLDTHGYPGGGGVVFSNESGQLDVIPVSVNKVIGNYCDAGLNVFLQGLMRFVILSTIN